MTNTEEFNETTNSQKVNGTCGKYHITVEM